MGQESLLEIHRQAMIAAGERAIVMNRNSLAYCADSARDQARNMELLQSCMEIATYYLWCLISNHPFLDGNKRAAYQAAYIFLEANGYTLGHPAASEVVATLNGIATGRLSKTELRTWIQKHIIPLTS